MPGGLDFLVVSLGGTGDTHPVLAVAVELKNRGHRVRFVGNARFAALAASLQMDFVGHDRADAPVARTLPSPYARRLRNTVAHSWLYQAASRDWRRKRSYIGGMRWLYELISTQADPRRTIVIARANSFAARLAQEKLGVRLISMQLQPAAFRSIYDSPGLPLPAFAGPRMRSLAWSLVDTGLGFTIAPPLNQFRSELGLEPVRRPLRQWIYSPDLVIALFPGWFGPPQPDWPPNTHAVGFPFLNDKAFRQVPQEFEHFVSAGEPPIVFTRGSHFRSPEAYTFFETSIEIARLLNRRAIFLARERDWIPKVLPEHVRYFGYIPLSAVLPHSAAMVHHGGVGTTAYGFAAGIPQIAVPLSDDQPDNAARIHRSGTGLRLSPGEYKAVSVAGKLQSLFDSDQVRANCHRLATAMAAEDSLGKACRLIEDWALRTGHRSKD